MICHKNIKHHFYLDKDCHFCPEGYCIPLSLKCDGLSQCSDGSDEENCKTTTEISNTCPHQCPEGYCIPLQLVCDGITHCSDKSDEENCQSYYHMVVSTTTETSCPHQCPGGFCLPLQLVCDGTSQCSDNSDEMNCQINTLPPTNTNTDLKKTTQGSATTQDTTTEGNSKRHYIH